MSVITAKTAGFCWGVRRAVDMVLAALRQGRDPYAVYGQLVHNPQVISALEERGVKVCTSPESMDSGTLFLRTHGTPRKERRRLARLPVNIRDLTCPRVGRALALANKKSSEGYDVIVLGDPSHQEVRAILSYGGSGARVITGPEDVSELKGVSKPFFLSQTTQNTEKYREAERALRERFPELESVCTICDSTELRQEELRSLCRRVDCVVVVGGKNSANTARLAEIAREEGVPSFHVETQEELDPDEISRYDDVLLTAGASTPSWSIRKVRETLLEIQGGGLRMGRLRRFISNAIHGNFHVLPVTFVLGAAAAGVLGITDWVRHVLAASLFLYGVHTLTSVLESEYSHPSGLRRQEFLRKHRRALTVISICAFSASIAIALLEGLVWTAVLAVMLLAFLVYSLPLIRKVYPFRGLRSIHGSRDLMFAGAWSFLLAFLPGYMAAGQTLKTGTALWAGILFFLFLCRCLVGDLVDLQGDALMGMDTIPIQAGRSRSIALLWICFILTGLLLFTGMALDYLTFEASGLAAGLISLVAGYLVLKSTPFPSELEKRFITDGSLFVAGAAPVLLSLAKGSL